MSQPSKCNVTTHTMSNVSSTSPCNVPADIANSIIPLLLMELSALDQSGNISGPILDNFYMFMALIPLLLEILQYLLLAIGALLLTVAAILAFISMQQVGIMCDVELLA